MARKYASGLRPCSNHELRSHLLRTIGGRRAQFSDSKTAHLANVDYLHAAAKMLVEEVASKHEGQAKFRFVYCSGMYTERDPTKKLYFLDESRKLKVIMGFVNPSFKAGRICSRGVSTKC